jgi:hypothetical protein
VLGLLPLLALACAAAPDPARYRLAESGSQWEMVGEDRILNDVQRRYPEFFAVILDPTTSHEPDLRPIREDIERHPIDRRNYDALNAIAIAYFELNARAEADRGGSSYLSDSFRSAKLVAIPWRAYGQAGRHSLARVWRGRERIAAQCDPRLFRRRRERREASFGCYGLAPHANRVLAREEGER